MEIKILWGRSNGFYQCNQCGSVNRPDKMLVLAGFIKCPACRSILVQWYPGAMVTRIPVENVSQN